MKRPTSDEQIVFLQKAITRLREDKDAIQNSYECQYAQVQSTDALYNDLIEWVCHDGGKIQRWAEAWQPIEGELSEYIRTRLLFDLETRRLRSYER